MLMLVIKTNIMISINKYDNFNGDDTYYYYCF